jgi:hypothetical protein
MNRIKEISDYAKLEWLVFAIQEAINGNNGELENALEVVEILREPYLEGDKI